MAGGRCRFRYGPRHRMKLKRQSELTLPTRTAIVQTPFTVELGSEATRIISTVRIAAAGRSP